jgi:hypothetical protein
MRTVLGGGGAVKNVPMGARVVIPWIHQLIKSAARTTASL